MSDTLRVLLPDGRTVEAALGIWLSALLGALPAATFGTVLARVQTMPRDATRWGPPNGALVVGRRTPGEGGG